MDRPRRSSSTRQASRPGRLPSDRSASELRSAVLRARADAPLSSVFTISSRHLLGGQAKLSRMLESGILAKSLLYVRETELAALGCKRFFQARGGGRPSRTGVFISTA